MPPEIKVSVVYTAEDVSNLLTEDLLRRGYTAKEITSTQEGYVISALPVPVETRRDAHARTESAPAPTPALSSHRELEPAKEPTFHELQFADAVALVRGTYKAAGSDVITDRYAKLRREIEADEARVGARKDPIRGESSAFPTEKVIS